MTALSRRDALYIAATVLILALPLLLGAGYIWRKHQWVASELERIAPRYARLEGLQAQAEPLQEQRAALQTQLAQYVYPAAFDATQAGNDAQQRVRDVLSSAGLTVVSSQVLPLKQEQGFDRIALSVRVEGELLSLQSALAVLPGLTPVVLLDGLNIQVVGAQRADKPQRLAAQLDLSALHVPRQP